MRQSARSPNATLPKNGGGATIETITNRVGAALSPDRIRLDLSVANKNQVLEEAARLFTLVEGCEPTLVAASLAAREALGSTGLGHGFAIPHARLKGLRRAVAAFLRPKFAVPFDAPDGKPVSDVLVLLLPEQAAEEHLELLAQAAEMFNERRFRDHLHHQSDAPSLYQALVDWPAIAE